MSSLLERAFSQTASIIAIILLQLTRLFYGMVGHMVAEDFHDSNINLSLHMKALSVNILERGMKFKTFNRIHNRLNGKLKENVN